MRLLSTLLFLFITCWGYAPAGWAQRNHEDDTAEIVHFIFYSDEGAPSVDPAGGAIGCRQCDLPRINDPADCTAPCICPRCPDNIEPDPDTCACCAITQEGCEQPGTEFVYDGQACTCTCPLVNNPGLCTGNTPDAHTNNGACFCGCDRNQAACANNGLWFDADTCTCINCPLNVAACAAQNSIFNAGACSCGPCPPDACQEDIPQNNLGYRLETVISNNACACACVSDNPDNQNLDWDNANQQCFQNGCALTRRFSRNDTPDIMDGCCPGEQTAFDSNNDNTNDSCCEATRLYDSDGDNIVDACCAVNLVNGVCPCMDANNNPFIYVQDEDKDPHEFFSDDLVAQANRACGGCPVYKTQNGTRYQLTEIDLGNNRHTCTLRCEENFYQGIADGPGNIIDDDFVCPCMDDRNFATDANNTPNPHTQIGSSGQYCECAANFRRVIRTDAQRGNFETCVKCQTYDKDPELFRNVLDFYGIDKNSIKNGNETIHCPANGGAGFANQNSRAQTVGINNVACPPMAAMTNAGGPETDPTCSYGADSDGLVYCYTGTLTNTVGVDHAAKDGDELGKFGRCQDKLPENIQLDENAINTRLRSLSNNGKAIRIGLNQGALYIVPQETLKQLGSCAYEAPCNGCDYTWVCNFGNSIRETRVMYYGLYSCPFGADADGNCDQKCTNIANSEIRSQNGITYCVCKNGYVPDQDANHPYKDTDIPGIRQPGICTSFSAFRVMAPTIDCLWKGCTEALTGHKNGGRQYCPGQYLCSASNNKTNYPAVPNGSAGNLQVCRKKDSVNCPSADFPKTAGLFDDCPPAAGSTSSYFWDDEIWGGKLDQQLMSDETASDKITVDEYIEHYYERSCTVVQSGLPYCAQGQTIYTRQNDKYVRQCDCPGLTYPTSPTGKEKCCGFGQIYKNGDCYACPAQSYAISLTDTSCTTCDTGFARNALDLAYARQDGNNPCFQCDAYSFPLEYTAGCYTCAENQIPIYTNASTRATAKTKYDKRCKSANDDCSGDYHWECYTCPDDTVPDGNPQNPDCKPCDQITTPADRNNLNKYACETCGFTWRNNSCS